MKEEKLLIASSQWGSFFTHSINNENGSNDGDDKHEINTFWGDVIRRNSCLAIPLLDYMAGRITATILLPTLYFWNGLWVLPFSIIT